MVEGQGSPQSEQYQKAIQALYALTFTIKMSKMSGKQPVGYFEYVVPPLEGVWQTDNKTKDDWAWISMIRQTEFVTKEVFDWAVGECSKKKPEIDLSKAAFASYTEGLCVQIMHIGAYAEEKRSFDIMEEYIKRNGLKIRGEYGYKHREIYLSDPRKTAPQKLKTVLRWQVEKI